MGVKERLEFIRSFGYGFKVFDQFAGLSGNALRDVLEKVGYLVLVSPTWFPLMTPWMSKNPYLHTGLFAMAVS